MIHKNGHENEIDLSYYKKSFNTVVLMVYSIKLFAKTNQIELKDHLEIDIT